MEKRDLYNENSEVTSKTYYKGEPIPAGYFPMVAMICIQNSKGEFLMQKRVPEKGGDWGVTGGHPTSGETPYEGIVRETKEEIGIDISNETLEVFSQGCDGVDCYKMYYLKADYDITDFIIQKEELSEVKWFSIETLNHMIETNELNPNQVACIMKCYKYLNSKK